MPRSFRAHALAIGYFTEHPELISIDASHNKVCMPNAFVTGPNRGEVFLLKCSEHKKLRSNLRSGIMLVMTYLLFGNQ